MRLTQLLPKKHLLLIGGLATLTLTLGLIGLVPSEQVSSGRSEIPLSIDAHNTPDAKKVIAQVLPAKGQALDGGALDNTLRDLDAELGQWHSVTIKSGDNLSALFSRQGLDAGVVYSITSTPKFGKTLSLIRPKETLEFRINDQGELTQLRYVQSRLKSLFF